MHKSEFQNQATIFFTQRSNQRDPEKIKEDIWVTLNHELSINMSYSVQKLINP